PHPCVEPFAVRRVELQSAISLPVRDSLASVERGEGRPAAERRAGRRLRARARGHPGGRHGPPLPGGRGGARGEARCRDVRGAARRPRRGPWATARLQIPRRPLIAARAPPRSTTPASSRNQAPFTPCVVPRKAAAGVSAARRRAWKRTVATKAAATHTRALAR